jgi:hypothetical protein
MEEVVFSLGSRFSPSARVHTRLPGVVGEAWWRGLIFQLSYSAWFIVNGLHGVSAKSIE